jgi:membrane protease YdiL (CAAX protease family)
MKNPQDLKPLPFLSSLLYFELPALLFVVGFWVLMPWFIRLGMLPYYAYLLGLGLPLVLLLLLSVFWLRLEGREITWDTLKARFRLHPMDRKAWLWSVGALLLGSVFGYGIMSLLSSLMIRQGIIPIPTTVPAFMNPASLTDPMTAYNEAVGGLRGNWLPFIAISILFVFNILGEEFWWRGVVLPRQELAFGKWAWVVHGVMWAFFHIFKWWDVLNLLPICLALSFVSSKLKNTTTGIVIHGVTNGVALLSLLAGILGWVG